MSPYIARSFILFLLLMYKKINNADIKFVVAASIKKFLRNEKMSNDDRKNIYKTLLEKHVGVKFKKKKKKDD